MERALTSELINELTQGMENAKQLRFHLYTSSPSKARDLLLQEMLSSYEKMLWILKASGSTSNVSGSSVSIDGSPKNEGLNKNNMDHGDQRDNSPKKRKLQPTWTGQVRVYSENGLEGPAAADGYSWRKYGQKDILGAKYPRSYYRCTYRSLQDCWATKQVQRSDDDPTIFEITYKGTHTCNNSLTTIPIQSPPDNQDSEHTCHDNELSQQQNQALLNMQANNLGVNNEDLDNKEMMMPAHFFFPACHDDTEDCFFPISGLVDDNHLGTYSPVIYSSSTVTSESSNYLPAPNYQMNSYGEARNLGNSRSDIVENISAHASTTNSPIGGMEFQIDPIIDLDPNFPFNASGFF